MKLLSNKAALKKNFGELSAPIDAQSDDPTATAIPAGIAEENADDEPGAAANFPDLQAFLNATLTS